MTKENIKKYENEIATATTLLEIRVCKKRLEADLELEGLPLSSNLSRLYENCISKELELVIGVRL